ncbi:MAG: anhydro-N-acetylmuramic acid kinase [Proteobacteria bacterium]|nr:anhydro-N-acetylmuramic acid kinase [Pseudomonadota bacterium]
MRDSLYVGLMSGTSIDAIDSAVLRFSDNDISIVASREHPIPTATRQAIATLSHSGADEVEKMGKLDRELGILFAQATLALLDQAAIPAQDIAAIGSHGQTIRHRPPSAGHSPEQSFTLQIGDPNTIAEITGITTVADFRRRDIAAGGEGAPLAPAFHAAAFAHAGVDRAIVNIGGIANASLLAGTELLMGFDTGPGNTLLDSWVARHRGERYDKGGNWAAEGQVDAQLLARLMQHPYLDKTGPRSTGKEAFNMDWLASWYPSLDSLDAQSVQATLAEYTAATIARGLASCDLNISEVYICGGGVHNDDLMRRLYEKLAPAKLDTTTALGLDPDWVEAAAFAWLARQSLTGLAGNAPVVTGAKAPRVLGGVFPA